MDPNPVITAQVEHDEGLHIVFYGAEGDDRYADGDTVFVPRRPRQLIYFPIRRPYRPPAG